ncbi:MAG: efflux RND transporter periplasmic adaptor subunit [Gemmatimonadota bacterium]|jgi:membrane fusion protein (multidrug efflux system)
MSEERRTRVRLLAALALVGGVAAGCGGRSAAAGSAAQDTVVLSASDVATVHTGTVEAGVLLTGSLDPHRVVKLTAQVAGTVRNIRVDRGSQVKAGDPLAVIEAAGVRGQAEGARAAVAAADAGLALARQRLESAKTLHDAGAMSDIDYESAKAQYAAAQAQLAAAKAQAAGAGEAASRTVVRAPMTGAISARDVEEGEPVGVGHELFTEVNIDVLELSGQVPVEDASRIHVGQRVVFDLTAYPDRTFKGEVSRVEPTADQETRQVGVYARLPNKDHALVGGLFAHGRIVTQAEDSVVVAPLAAVRGTTESPFVYAIENGVLTRRPVQLGLTDDVRRVVEVTAGLPAGTQVLVAPGQDIAEGTQVRVGGGAIGPDAPPVQGEN